MMENIYTPDLFTCPNCKTEFDETALMDILHSPFSGSIIECKNCNKEFDGNVFIKLEEV